MIELEIYAAGVRDLDKILELDHALGAIPGLRYKVDSNHDIVYLEADQPTFTLSEIEQAFERLDLKPRMVGAVPEELEASNAKKKTQRLN
ncbi:MAG TPA: hypothetical protein VNQ90_16660 [Chthoniobacteraceae bacterium]|nr:hypothetical protein [Chthoniobacteraceae bacterium]